MTYTPTFNSAVDCAVPIDRAAEDIYARIPTSQEGRGVDMAVDAVAAFIRFGMDV